MAASVVWLTVAVIITLTPDLFSGWATDLPGLSTVFDSDFFVTGAFDCAATGFALAFDKGVVVDVATAWAVFFVVILMDDFLVAGATAFAFLPGLTAAVA